MTDGTPGARLPASQIARVSFMSMLIAWITARAGHAVTRPGAVTRSGTVPNAAARPLMLQLFNLNNRYMFLLNLVGK